MDPTSIPPDPKPTHDDGISPRIWAILVLWLGAATVAGVNLLADQAATNFAPKLSAGVNPNVAPWWELTALPRISPSLAQAIVHHRQDASVPHSDADHACFRQPSDLAAVHGIGPKTVQRIAADLDFSPPGPGSTTTPANRTAIIDSTAE